MSSEHPWIELAEELGAEVHRGWDGKMPVVQLRMVDTLVTVDLIVGDLAPSTRVQAFFESDGTFRFGVRSSRVSTELGKLLFGTQDILVGDRSFDRRFVVQGSDEARIRGLFSRPAVLEALKGYWNLTLTAGPPGRWQVGHVPDGLYHLCFKNGGTLSAERLRRVLGLFREILGALRPAAAGGRDDDVPSLVSRLRAPGGTLGMGRVWLWDGDTPRREAAGRLGELGALEAVEPLIEILADPNDALRVAAVKALEKIGAPEAVGPLMEVLADPEHALRLAAVEALEAIGDPVALPALAGLLGDHGRVGSTVIWERAAQALRGLGAGDLVHAFSDALQGRPGALRDCVYRYRAARPVARALTAVMKGSDLSAVEAAGRALGWLGNADVLPELRAIERVTGWDRSRKACRKAIAAIEAMPSLPRPADRPEEADHGTLPRVAGTPEPASDGLPRPAPEAGDEG